MPSVHWQLPHSLFSVLDGKFMGHRGTMELADLRAQTGALLHWSNFDPTKQNDLLRGTALCYGQPPLWVASRKWTKRRGRWDILNISFNYIQYR